MALAAIGAVAANGDAGTISRRPLFSAQRAQQKTVAAHAETTVFLLRAGSE
jgi:hypothetical protein